MLILLTGNDDYKCDRFILEHKSKIDPTWLEFCFHRYDTIELELAATDATSISLIDSPKLLVIQGEIKAEHEPYIKAIAESTATAILRVTLDARTKVGKLIKSFAKCIDFSLPSIWKTGALAAYIQQEATDMGLPMPVAAANYLAEAIGENSYRIHNELEKIALFRNGQGITLRQIKELVPNLGETAITLANAIRDKQHSEVLSLSGNLLNRGEHPMKINASLSTIFRRWLMVATTKDIADDALAKRLGLTNPKRLYYLRKEVAELESDWLTRAVISLFELECKLKRGLPEDQYQIELLGICV